MQRSPFLSKAMQLDEVGSNGDSENGFNAATELPRPSIQVLREMEFPWEGTELNFWFPKMCAQYHY